MIDLCKDTIRNPEDPYWELKERLDGIILINTILINTLMTYYLFHNIIGTALDLPILKHGKYMYI